MKRMIIIVFLSLIPIFLMGMNDKTLTVFNVLNTCPFAQRMVGEDKINEIQIKRENFLRNIFGQNADIISEMRAKQMDFGQYYDQRDFEDLIKENKKNNDFVIYASSMGTLTTLNYLAHEENNFLPKAVILIDPIASKNYYDYQLDPLASNLPFMYYVIPYINKVFGLVVGLYLKQPYTYSPLGEQPIKSIEKISKRSSDIPIIMVYKGLLDWSCSALYYGLVEHGNKNVYTIEFKKICNSIPVILKRYGITLSELKRDSFDVKISQPDHKQFKKQYEYLIRKEGNYPIVFYTTVVFSCMMLVFYIAYNYIDKCILAIP